ncbi:GDSL-type esterase/lipase family protein [Streptomyces sp. NPDC053474]|uniref:GDSL-type esterase/lipase family protein n=1 Tax=Streptomyces sp. NPDC053474 TaxID=3365704 RepID=UPI0037D50231
MNAETPAPHTPRSTAPPPAPLDPSAAQTAWTAAFRSAVLSPYESIELFERRGFADQTVRQVIRVAGGGSALRIRLSNQYGKTPLRVAGARLARRTRHSAVDTATDTPVLFDGATEVVVAPGAEVISDAVERAVRAGEEWALSLYLPEETGLSTYAAVPNTTGYAVPGNALATASLDSAEGLELLVTRHYVTGVDVLAPAGTPVTVAFGDSWFEGFGSTPDTDRRLTDLLNARLPEGAGWVVNQGLSANRLLTDEVGDSALNRLERDVLSVPGVTHVLVHLGVNDLGTPGQLAHPEPAAPPTAAALIAGLTTLADRLHAAGLTAIATTIGPYKGTIFDGYDSPAGQAVAREVNAWIRGADSPYDAYVDTAAAVADPRDPERIHPDLGSGDGLHVNDAGFAAMADAMDLSLLTTGGGR